MSRPLPFKPPAGDFPKESFEDLLPTRGFLTDFTYSLKGTEIPSVFAFWGAVHTMSVALKRDAYFSWLFGKRFPNMYIMLVAPPRSCGKSEVVKASDRVLKKYATLINDKALAIRKEPNIIRTRATPESLADALMPREVHYAEGSVARLVKTGSELAVIASEGSTFLGKQQYNQGLIDRLTHYFDCMDDDSDRTRKGEQRFHDMYVTCLIATTPDGVESAIPPEAFGGGFLSRLILVYKDKSPKEYPYPTELVDAATPDELARRLAWLAEVAQGEYKFDDDADAEYRTWYHTFKEKLLTQGENKGERGMNMLQRYDVHLMKLALIIRAQQYKAGTLISHDDFIQARKILDYTYKLNYIPTENVGSTPYDKHFKRVAVLLTEKKAMTRSELSRAMSPYKCYVDELGNILATLLSEGKIEVILDGKRQSSITRSTKEVYKWAADAS